MSMNSHSIAVTTLGTGTPFLDPERFSQSILVEAGRHKLLFDTGRNVATRLAQAGIVPASVEKVFFTHYHSDHTVGFADFWLTSWIQAGGGRTAPLLATGPTGIDALVEGHRTAFADDIRIRVHDQKLPIEGTQVIVNEFTEDGVVFDEDGIVVTAFDVDHGEAIKPNFGYRIDFDGRSVVISGDAKNDLRVASVAKGCDLLLHSSGAATTELASLPDVARILDHHTTPEEAGRIFAAASARLSVLIHIVRIGRPGSRRITTDEIAELARQFYEGEIVVADDLMRFEIGEKIKVIPGKE